MSVLGTTQGHLTTALINDHRVPVHLGHCSGGEQRGTVLVTVTAPVALTLDDVAVVLFALTLWEDFDDDEALRQAVAEFIVNAGCSGLDEAYGAVSDARQPALLASFRRRAATVFAPTQRAGAGHCGQGPALVEEVAR